ncbi:P-loop NTPase fold protein [Bifidobacterium sp. ESL0690]|uniref:P-loop NTPase fold protein n=1 Tax=Bifidobacterium sp. ESL0690 TaxID=2983214 RepID=UPI0023F8B21B|nr:P-loop NTPase fold protein [Bifidobacterium sp. ESL0690]WEV47275.1 P-loop NTPase fold protein [Bifidobacterium sp. ESL0690]
MSKEESCFLDDAPIDFESQDRYNRGKYVARLASYLLSTENNNGLVVGVTGPWGSGKTSVKNLLQRELRKEKKKPRDFIITNYRF